MYIQNTDNLLINKKHHMDFHRCEGCGRGRLHHPDILCLDCADLPHGRLAILDAQVEAGEITEGQYLIECNLLRATPDEEEEEDHLHLHFPT